jgi:hypothetical protein
LFFQTKTYPKKKGREMKYIQRCVVIRIIPPLAGTALEIVAENPGQTFGVGTRNLVTELDVFGINAEFLLIVPISVARFPEFDCVFGHFVTLRLVLGNRGNRRRRVSARCSCLGILLFGFIGLTLSED